MIELAPEVLEDGVVFGTNELDGALISPRVYGFVLEDEEETEPIEVEADVGSKAMVGRLVEVKSELEDPLQMPPPFCGAPFRLYENWNVVGVLVVGGAVKSEVD